MRDNIISYFDMCQKEGTSLQRGMNFRLRNLHSVILMSRRPNAPYHDHVEDDGATLIYEGHDVNRTKDAPNPKVFDQPEFTLSGKPTENGKFHRAAQDYKKGIKDPDIVRVYEKIKTGIWSDNGLFHLVDSWVENTGKRNVFKFKLIAVEGDTIDAEAAADQIIDYKHTRIIPSSIKQAVWKRDGGKCITCGAKDGLHFDHIIPYSKGGTSTSLENIQLLCARHNLTKKARIE